ncbi:hypothetical protein JR316_0001895 [Psilocybe cubensis]|uniref:Uncharacterized protein n=2 Tax=Psilocybe cubensis TaxID=181762 RepID=A0ACB8HBY5_PSICU|nr:hypothetical protein JR316_0001895 [Psilocybe cubensis]KAH9484991.1 hypothetical protein JR316_0001895 [Psilocybe cubensis]
MDTSSDVPVLSFPAILRNPGLSNRFAHLHGPSVTGNNAKQQANSRVSVKKTRRENEGKRWVRRKDNSRFVGNPHVVAASKRDYNVQLPQVQSTFPEPLPAYLPRIVKLPTTPTLPTTDPGSANAGRFSLSLKGMRRDLRRAGGKAEALVKDVESEMVQWLTLGGVVLSPDHPTSAVGVGEAQSVGTPVGVTGAITEVSRTPLQLVWRITDDAFARYVVHCCARYHEVVSYSKGTGDNRMTYLLRPNVTRPDRRAPASLETPPVTDIDYSSNPDTDIDSDFISDRDVESDMELDSRPRAHHLTAIDESPASVTAQLPSLDEEDSWSQVDEDGESDFDGFDSTSEFGSASIEFLHPRLEALSINDCTRNQDLTHELPEQSIDADKTVTEIDPQVSQAIDPSRYTRDRLPSGRSPSSPSRSPARSRIPRRRARGKKRIMTVGIGSGRTFYEYLFM